MQEIGKYQLLESTNYLDLFLSVEPKTANIRTEYRPYRLFLIGKVSLLTERV